MSVWEVLGSRFSSWRDFVQSHLDTLELSVADMKGPESSQCSTDDILSNPYSCIQFAFDKRRRNLEKRKSRLLQYEADWKVGKKLSEQQIEARYCIGEVDTQLEFLKDISRILHSLQKEYLRTTKERDDGMKKDLAEHERKRLEDFIYFQNVVKQFGKLEDKGVLLNGTDNGTKITEEECKLIENLSESFGLKYCDSETLKDFKKCKDGSMLAYSIIVGSEEKVMNDLSGIQIRRLLEKIANCEHMHHRPTEDQLIKEDKLIKEGQLTKEEEEFVKPSESAMEPEVEQPKKDPKVVFVRVSNGSVENYVESDISRIGDTEFGFESGIDPKALVRDPPPPIPFPATAVPEDSANIVSAPNHNVWNRETKEDVSSKLLSDGAKNGFINNVEQVNGFGSLGDERPQVRGAKDSGVQCNDLGNGGAKTGDFGKSSNAQHGRGGGTRRQERDNFDGPRNSRGAIRHGGRGFGSSGVRGGASNFASRGSGYRNANNSNNSHMNGGFKGNGNGGRGPSGSGYNGLSQQPRRKLGFNFASDAF
ncbi:unnamed protein product [Litomosoides sigmodontis]|uniref:Caprin-1 dimerization domain-containing protein n=1 Tax=Litomosoides sigmodontis TaxID=42156 RepID=A0A3P6TYS5_LITSI|nr:unnamed protein product [Litomosoides sigmodontis]